MKIFKTLLLLLLGYISTVAAAMYPIYNWIRNKIKIVIKQR